MSILCSASLVSSVASSESYYRQKNINLFTVHNCAWVSIKVTLVCRFMSTIRSWCAALAMPSLLMTNCLNFTFDTFNFDMNSWIQSSTSAHWQQRHTGYSSVAMIWKDLTFTVMQQTHLIKQGLFFAFHTANCKFKVDKWTKASLFQVVLQYPNDWRICLRQTSTSRNLTLNFRV